MDQMTQQNAAMAEQSTAASRSLAHEAQRLSGLIGQFRVGQVQATEPLPGKARTPAKARPAAKSAPAQAAGTTSSPRSTPTMEQDCWRRH
jgi:methyl-accepting chemotaxis protein